MAVRDVAATVNEYRRLRGEGRGNQALTLVRRDWAPDHDLLDVGDCPELRYRARENADLYRYYIERLQYALVLPNGRSAVRLVRFPVGDYFTADGQRVRVGRAGISDLIGFSTVAVGTERTPIYTEVEVKTERGAQREDQALRQQEVELYNGIYLVASHVRDAALIIQGHLQRRGGQVTFREPY